MSDTDAWLTDWRRFTEGLAGAVPDVGVATGLPGLQAARAAFGRFAEDYGRIAQPTAGAGIVDLARFNSELRALGERLLRMAVPTFPQAAGTGPEWLTALEAFSSSRRKVVSKFLQLIPLRQCRPSPMSR